MDPFRLWDRMGQDIIVDDNDETKSEEAETKWMELIRSPRPDRANDVKFRQYRFAMMACAVDEMNANANILNDFEELVFGAKDWYNRGRPIYRDIMEQIIFYLQRAKGWLEKNPGKEFIGTRDIPNPWRIVTPPKQRPAGCTAELEEKARKCLANKDAAVSASPNFSSKSCKDAMRTCDIR